MHFRLTPSSVPASVMDCENCGEGLLPCPQCRILTHWFFCGIRVESRTRREFDVYRPFCGCGMVITEAPRMISMFTHEDYSRSPLDVIAEHADYQVNYANDPFRSVIIEPSSYGALLPWRSGPSGDWDEALLGRSPVKE